MSSIRFTVKRLYALENERMVATTATARIYVGDLCIATEEVEGFTESPVFKHIHHPNPEGHDVRVEWDTPGFAEMTVVEESSCPCCQQSEIL